MVVTEDKKTIESSKAIVLPGVGAFGKCIENLKRLDLFDFLKGIIKEDKLYLGICLGMQILFESSEEAPDVEGMGFIRGTVARFKGGVKVPHMGWNGIEIVKDHPVFKGIENGANFYFVHSFCCKPAEEGVTTTTTQYGGDFCSSVARGRVFACQFHPEKSQKVGLRLLRNFIHLTEKTYFKPSSTKRSSTAAAKGH